MLVKGDYQGTFSGYEVTGGIKKHPTGEISWNVVARPTDGAMKSYWVKDGEFLNPIEQTAYLVATDTRNLKIGHASSVSESEKEAVLEAIREWSKKPRI